MSLNEAEYSSLRAEIIEEQSSVSNLLVAMYTVFIAVITFAIDKNKSYLFVAAIFITLLFKLQFLSKNTGVLKLSAYIIVNYERKNKEIGWESDIESAFQYRGKFLKRWFEIVGISSSKAATIMILFGVALNLILSYQWQQDLYVRVWEIAFEGICCFISIFLDIMYSSDNIRDMFIREFEKVNSNK